MARLKITLVRSTIGCVRKQKATAEALGLRKIGSSAVREDTPQVRGMIDRIGHLVRVESAELETGSERDR